jgi:hypothetical protein
VRAKVIHAPDGRVWTVRRHWAPRLGGERVWDRFRRRFRQGADAASNAGDVGDGCLGDLGDGIAVAIVVIVVVLVVLFVAIPIIVAIVDLLIVLLLAALGVAGRVLLRRPWLVEASAAGGLSLEYRVVGFRASAQKRDDLANLLTVGATLPPTG